MKWHGFFSFIVPPGLLLVFPELSLVHCDRVDTVDKCEEKDSREEYCFDRSRGCHSFQFPPLMRR